MYKTRLPSYADVLCQTIHSSADLLSLTTHPPVLRTDKLNQTVHTIMQMYKTRLPNYTDVLNHCPQLILIY